VKLHNIGYVPRAFYLTLLGCFFGLLFMLVPASAQPATQAIFQETPSFLSKLLGTHTAIASDVNPEPLPITVAFKTQAMRDVNSGATTIRFETTAGYYLYREKIKAALLRPSHDGSAPTLIPVLLGLPEGASHYDEIFKKNVVIYRGTITVPLMFTASNTQALEPMSLVLYSQGCADLGVCYPPRIQLVSFDAQATRARLSELKTDPAMVSEPKKKR
jgi:thiol:disulfide interchange protein